MKLSKMFAIYPNWSMRTSIIQRRMQTYSRVSGSFELAPVTLKRNRYIGAQTICCRWGLLYSSLADSVTVQVMAHAPGLLFCHLQEGPGIFCIFIWVHSCPGLNPANSHQCSFTNMRDPAGAKGTGTVVVNAWTRHIFIGVV